MSKLLKLKEWLTIKEAAAWLSASAGEDVSEADILRFAIDGHLTLSVYFVNHAYGARGKIVPYSETTWTLIDPLIFPSKEPISANNPLETTDTNPLPENLKILYANHPTACTKGAIACMTSLKIDEDRYLNLEQEIRVLRGVWDLAMWGGEALDVENHYQNMTGGPNVTLVNLEGAFVLGSDGHAYQLKESWDHNEFQAGSHKQLEAIKQKAYEEELSPEALAKLIEQHEENRKKLLEDMRSKKENGQEHENYYPAAGLPSDSTLVVRTACLRAFEEKLLSEDAKPEKPITPKERQSVSQIIAALAEMANLNISKPYKAVESIRTAAAGHIELPNSNETIVKFLKAASEQKCKN